MAITVNSPKHRVKRVHVIPFEETGECYEHKPILKKIKGPVKKSELSVLEEQGLQALLSLHSDIRPLARQDAETRQQQGVGSAKERQVAASKVTRLASKISQDLDASDHPNNAKTTIRFLGDPLAVPCPPPPLAKPLALPPPLPRVPYGYVFPAKGQHRDTSSPNI